MIIQSILDNDLYKFTMQMAVLANFPNTKVSYEFKDRRPTGKFNNAFCNAFEHELQCMAQLQLHDDEIEFIKQKLPFLNRPDYIAYLSEYHFDPKEVNFGVNEAGELSLSIVGDWASTILWEVPLLAIISELYYTHCDRDWTEDNQTELADKKSTLLSQSGCIFADFGTRRRRQFDIQDNFVKLAKGKTGFVGTSNVFLAQEHDVKAIGTMAHEWIMGVSGMDGLRRANKRALWRWADTYDGNLGIALTDTYGTEAFFEDFEGKLARMYDGVRHDSGDPIKFGERVIKHYESLGIKPTTKNIVFSDGLTVDKAIEINEYFKGKINVSFGIGTHFTNDFANSPALSIVIKLRTIDDVPVVKISDEPAKIQGDPDACRVAKWTFFGEPLDT